MRLRLHREMLANIGRIVDGLAHGGQHVLVLNDYQVSNLLSALQAAGCCGFHDEHGDSPLDVMNTGNWLGEIFTLLPYVEHKANVDPSELRRRAREMQCAAV